jgi:hypothetical protein
MSRLFEMHLGDGIHPITLIVRADTEEQARQRLIDSLTAERDTEHPKDLSWAERANLRATRPVRDNSYPWSPEMKDCFTNKVSVWCRTSDGTRKEETVVGLIEAARIGHLEEIRQDVVWFAGLDG